MCLWIYPEFPEECKPRESVWENKKVGKSKTHFKVQNLLYLRKSICGLKSDGETTIRFHIVRLGGTEMATEVHGDGGNILTKGWG